MTSNRRTVFSGVSVIAPNGSTTKEFWDATLNGVSGIGPVRSFDASGYPVHVAGEVDDFAPRDTIDGRLMVQTDRWTQFGLVAAGRALEDAGVDPQQLGEYDMSVITATSSGGNEFGQREIQKLWDKGSRFVGPYQSIAWFYAATTGQISIRHGMKGACGVLVGEQAGGLDALGQSRRALRDDATTVVTGGTDAPLGPYALACHTSAGLMTGTRDVERAYRPFDAEADGYVAGEGGAIFVVESEDTWRARDADHGYGELAGYAATFDPAPGSGREPGLRRAIVRALADARVDPSDVDVVFADGLGVPAADLAEAQAIAAVFGENGVPVTVPKCLVGRLHAGGAPLDVATALLSIRDSVIPGTPTLSTPAPGIGLDLVRETRQAPVRTALVLARGFEGFNAAVVVKAL
ncbi:MULTISPECIES: ketosynthase chain-length factor [unclassified Streptomyces]|uniref:ketosynthase chain-length factor n=1 Tax=unclassified Streptomyces TaxID=2593676 RepID=UPI002E17E3A2|nr:MULTISPECIES: ketosynthase chain-length factor [unclassified Streptomyces]